MDFKAIFIFATLFICHVSSTYYHQRSYHRFGLRAPAMQPLFPMFPKFYVSNPLLTKPPPPMPAPVPDIDRIVRFHLFTRQNRYKAEELDIDRKRTQATSYFKVNKKTKILIHGFVDSTTDSSAGEWMNMMRDAYLAAEDVNVIVVDYSFIALIIFYWTNLPQMSSTRIAELVYFLNNSGSPYDSFHLIGRSWGAHVAGMAGHTLSGKIGRITGLDPVHPPFRFIGFQYRLDKTDAKFVDVYHLNGKSRFNLLDVIGVSHRYDGLSAPMGHVDIYPNHRIREETGCPVPNAHQYTATCRLGVGARIFTETITRSDAFVVCPCETFLKYLRGDCKCDMRNIIDMGEHISQSATGVYQISEFTMVRPPQPKPTQNVPVITMSSTTTTTRRPSEDVPTDSGTSTTTTAAPENVSPESSTTEASVSTSDVPILPSSTAAVATEISASESTSTSTTAVVNTSETITGTSESSSSSVVPDDSNSIPDNIPSESSSTEGLLSSSTPAENVPALEVISTASSTTSTSTESSVNAEASETEATASSPAPPNRVSSISLSEDGQSASSSALGRRQQIV